MDKDDPERRAVIPLEPDMSPRTALSAPAARGQGLLIAWALVTSNLFALVITLLFEFLSLRGVVHLGASRVVLLLTWLFAELIVVVFVLGKGITAKWRTLLGGGLILAVLLLALDYWTPKPDPSTSPATFSSMEILLKKYLGGRGSPSPNPAPNSLAPIASTSVPPQREVTVYFSCDAIHLPMQMSIGSVLYVLNPLGEDGIVPHRIGVSDGFWPFPHVHGYIVYRCELVNYSPDPIFATRMLFTARMLELLKGDDGIVKSFACGKVLTPYGHMVEISIVPPNGCTSQFYLWNGTNDCAEFTLPNSATLELGSTSRRTVKLKHPNSILTKRPITIFPAEVYK